MPRFGLILLALFCTGCAASSMQAMQVYMDSRIGVLTYDEAIARNGAPTTITQGDAVFVAEWISEHTDVISTTVPSPYLGMTYSMPMTHGDRLRLVFHRQDQTMAAWHYERW